MVPEGVVDSNTVVVLLVDAGGVVLRVVVGESRYDKMNIHRHLWQKKHTIMVKYTMQAGRQESNSIKSSLSLILEIFLTIRRKREKVKRSDCEIHATAWIQIIYRLMLIYISSYIYQSYQSCKESCKNQKEIIRKSYRN